MALTRSAPLARRTPLKRSRKTLKIRRDVLDALWSKIVRLRDGGRCRRCGSTPAKHGLHAHHIMRRRKRGTRWDPLCGLAVCYGCHSWISENPDESVAWEKSQVGAEQYEWLKAKNAAAVKVDRKAVRAYLTDLLRRMQGTDQQ